MRRPPFAPSGPRVRPLRVARRPAAHAFRADQPASAREQLVGRHVRAVYASSAIVAIGGPEDRVRLLAGGPVTRCAPAGRSIERRAGFLMRAIVADGAITSPHTTSVMTRPSHAAYPRARRASRASACGRGAAAATASSHDGSGSGAPRDVATPGGALRNHRQRRGELVQVGRSAAARPATSPAPAASDRRERPAGIRARQGGHFRERSADRHAGTRASRRRCGLEPERRENRPPTVTTSRPVVRGNAGLSSAPEAPDGAVENPSEGRYALPQQGRRVR